MPDRRQRCRRDALAHQPAAALSRHGAGQRAGASRPALGVLTSLMKDKSGDIPWRLRSAVAEDRSSTREAIWSAVRSVALNTVAPTPELDRRMHVSADSKIQRIEVDTLRSSAARGADAGGRARVAGSPRSSIACRGADGAHSGDRGERRQGPQAGRVVPAAAVTTARRRLRALGRASRRRGRSMLKQSGVDTSDWTSTSPCRATIEKAASPSCPRAEAPRSSKVRDAIDRVRDRLKGDAKE